MKSLEICDQVKCVDHEWYEAMVNVNIHIFEMSNEEAVTHYMRLENFEKIRWTNIPL
jgi:hypothetical protein